LQIKKKHPIFVETIKTNDMKTITQSERPIGKNSNYSCFYSEDVVKETDRAFLVSMYFERIGEKANRWLPKSKMLAFEHVDNRDLIYNGNDFVKNPNYGKARVQYFISSFFTKDKGAEKPDIETIAERNENKTW
jgi:hypothetical protein